MLTKNEAENKIKSIIDSNGLVCDVNFKEFIANKKKDMFTTLVRGNSQQKYIFRFTFNKYIKSTQKEVFLYTKKPKQIKHLLPLIVDYEIDQDYAWLIYKYINGDTSGNVYQFSNNINFNKLFSSVSKICNLNMNDNIFIEMSDKNWVKLLERIITKSWLYIDEKISSIVNYLKKLQKPESRYYAHGDLHPGNVILNKGKIKIIDWESSHISCYGFDLSFLYIRSYDNKIRNRIISLVEGRERDDMYGFYYALSVNLLRDYFEWQLIKEGKNVLMDKKDIINGVSLPNIMDDLYKQIITNFNRLKKMER